jgi:hypothetical protein
MAKDIILEDNDLKIINGDFIIDNSDEQNIENILVSFKGDWKQWPLIGVGIIKYIHSPQTYSIKRTIEKEIMLQLKYDNAKEIKVKYDDKLIIEAKYD